MSLPVVLRPEAQNDLLYGRDWYDGQSPGRGDLFTDEVEQALARIALRPEMYAVLYRGVRPCKVRKYPYVIYYRVLSDRIDVIGVLHGRRDPGAWQSRA